MTTVDDLVEQTFDHLYGNRRQRLTTLDGAIASAAATSVGFTSISDIGAGAFIEVDTELMYVQSVNQSARTAEVIRGMRGTTAATHADDALVDIEPIFPRYRIMAALKAEIASWPQEVFRVEAFDLDTVDGVSGYDLDGIGSAYYGILDVQLGPRTMVDDAAVVRPSFVDVRHADTGIYPSGSAVVLTGLVPSEVRDVRVVVAVPFDVSTFDAATDLEADVGLASTMLDIPPIGAAWRLMTPRDVKRSLSDAQPEPRNAEEVPPGFAGSVATFLRRTRDLRLGEEAVRLRAKYPIRRT